MKAAGILLGGVGIFLLGSSLLHNADAIGEKGMSRIGAGIKGGLEGHMLAEAAGRQQFVEGRTQRTAAEAGVKSMMEGCRQQH